MIRNQRDKDLQTKQQGGDYRATPTSSRLWSGLKNPRIVRVSRAFGGKDRHSKVNTVRGLRDRRVRLSVPTAIQLYDLQDRLGLNQPSKVVDWLLNAAQNEIDRLPPLQLPPEGFFQFSQSHSLSHEAPPLQASSNQHNGEDLITTIQREVLKSPPRDKGNSNKENEDFASAQVLSHEILQRSNPSLVSGFLSNKMPYASYYQWDAANAYLSQLGSRSSQPNEVPVMSIPSTRGSLALESQILFCPTGIMPSMFPSNVASPTDFSVKQFGQLQMASSISQMPQSNLDINSPHLCGPPARPF